MLRIVWPFAAVAMAIAGPNFAQTAAAPPQTTAPTHTGQKPVDVGPYTPQANAAYQGGGVVLQGAPGAPAPKPQATPPGQEPKNVVPPQ